jgi:predicted secreted protein
MLRPTYQTLSTRLTDERGKRVIFVAHCLLNQNTRYLGGAFRRGCVDEFVEGIRQEGLGIVQMHCPEQCAWGGVRKRHILRVYGTGARGTLLYRLLPVLYPPVVAYTRWRYRVLARRVAREIADYLGSGIAVEGIIGVGGSPSCGVSTTLDMRRSLKVLASTPITALDRQTMNEQAIVSCLREGQGLFVEAVRRQLHRRRLSVRWYEHDLLDEIRGRPPHLRLCETLCDVNGR